MRDRIPRHRGLELAASCREALVTRKILSSDAEPITDGILEHLLRRENILLAVLGMSDKVSAVYMRIAPYALILVNRTHTVGHQRFSIAHELCHHYFHEDLNTWICSIRSEMNDPYEREASEFAAAFLLPAKAVGEQFFRFMDTFSDLKRVVLELCIFYGTSWQSTIYRLADMGLITARQRNELLEASVTSLAREFRLDPTLFSPSRSVKMPVEFEHVARDLLERAVISEQKFESLMADLLALAECDAEPPEGTNW